MMNVGNPTLAFDFAVIGGAGQYLCKPMLLDNQGGVIYPELPGGDPIDAFVSELAEVTRAIEEGRPSDTLGGHATDRRTWEAR